MIPIKLIVALAGALGLRLGMRSRPRKIEPWMSEFDNEVV